MRYNILVKLKYFYLQWLYLQIVVLFLQRASLQEEIKDKLPKSPFGGIKSRKQRNFPLQRLSGLPWGLGLHIIPSFEGQLAPQSPEKLSALNRCLSIVLRLKSKSGRGNGPPPATPPLWNNSYYSPARAAPLSFSPKRPNMAFTPLFECFFPLSSFISLTKIWRQEVEFIWCILWVYYFSPDWWK